MSALVTEPDTVRLDLPAAALDILAEAAGIDLRPLGLSDAAHEPGRVRTAVRSAVRAGLVARRILTAEGELADAALGTLFHLLATPHVRAQLHLELAGNPAPVRYFYAADPNTGISLSEPAPRLVRLDSFPTDRLLGHLLADALVGDRPASAGEGFEVSGPDWRRARAADTEAAMVGALGASDQAAPFARAWWNPTVRARVTVLRPASASAVAGGIVRWLDGGAAGVWLIPDPDPDPDPDVDGERPVALVPVSTRDLGVAIAEHFPRDPN